MHGVGWKTLQAVFKESGFAEPIAALEQRDPDPAFPTVAFPNPEEKGALDIAIALAKKNSVDVLLANDPDADRFAAAAPNSSGDWITLRGDQIGSLLGWWLVERAKLAGSKLTGTFANSIVSSMMLESIAKSAGLNYESTLTGFKWVSRVNNLAFGYEEALGYCVDPTNVSDKDGISAAAMFMEMLA
jgi:phosphomannomutase